MTAYLIFFDHQGLWMPVRFQVGPTKGDKNESLLDDSKSEKVGLASPCCKR